MKTVANTTSIADIAKTVETGAVMVHLDNGSEVVVMSSDDYATLLDKTQTVEVLDFDTEIFKDM